jgi:hypothetical protein
VDGLLALGGRAGGGEEDQVGCEGARGQELVDQAFACAKADTA